MEEDRLSEIAFHFSNLKWVLGINRTESTFLTSDNPISIVPHCKYGPIPLAGLSSKGVEVFIPLSPECILIMRDGDYHRAFADLDMHYIELKDKRFIDSYNAVVCMFAERCIYSTDGDFSLLEQLKGEDSRMLQAHQTTLDWGEETIKSRVR